MTDKLTSVYFYTTQKYDLWRVKRPGRDADHSPPPSAEVKE